MDEKLKYGYGVALVQMNENNALFQITGRRQAAGLISRITERPTGSGFASIIHVHPTTPFSCPNGRRRYHPAS